MGSFNQIYETSIYGNTKLFCAVYAVFSDESLLKYYLKVEGALAKVQGDLGIIPEESAAKILHTSASNFLDKTTYSEVTSIVGFPIVAITNQLTVACGKHGKYVHWGATTQDIMDTALMLQLKETLKSFEAELVKIVKALAVLIKKHRLTIMVGRSQMQHGIPITFGFKASLWLSPILDHLTYIKSIRNKLLFVQFGGAVGTLASLDDGLLVRKALAEELKLNDPVVSWHSSREVLVEIMHRLTSVSGSLGKIGKDISLMSQTEIMEVSEQKVDGRGISSTMPQKRNPISAQGLIISARNSARLMNSVYDALLNDHERGTGVWQLEWMTIPNLVLNAAGGIGLAGELLNNLEVYPENMEENLKKTKGYIMAESVMMQLAKKIGKQKSHDLIHDLIDRAQKENKSFREIIQQDELASHYSKNEIDSWLNPQNYLGQTQPMIDAVIKKAEPFVKEK